MKEKFVVSYGRAYIESSLDLKKTDINQCDDGDPWNPFAKTNMCPEHSIVNLMIGVLSKILCVIS